MHRIRTLGAALALLALTGLAGALQEPKLGSAWYEDKIDLGFKVKAPKDWEFVPGSPLESNLIGKYADPGDGKYLNLGKEAFVMVELVLVKFDRRAGKKKEERQIGDQKIEFSAMGEKDIGSWMTKRFDEGKDWRVVEASEPFKCAVPGARLEIWEGQSTRGRPGESQPVRAFVVNYPLSPQLDVALIGLGPGGKKWGSFEKSFAAVAKTLQLTAVATADRGPVGDDPRSQKRAKLQDEVARSPGWSLHETPNYFILSSYGDRQFIDELKLRLEGIRAVYEADYPPSKARKAKILPPEDDEDGEGDSEEPPTPTPEAAGADSAGQGGTVAEKLVDTLELGRCSVVRVCKDRDQYLQYGGGASTGGYFNFVEEELVIFDDKDNRGRDFTWGVLSHEGLHQYIFAFFGNIAPHSWYNEGNGDYYFGFEFKNGKFKQGPARNRVEDVKSLIGENRHVPLQDFVRWTQAQYYGQNKGNGSAGGPLDATECYAQGWSLIWFLRTGAGKAKGWQKPWGSILDEYLETLLDTGDLDKAVDAAFAGVDWAAFEASWLAYTRP